MNMVLYSHILHKYSYIYPHYLDIPVQIPAAGTVGRTGDDGLCPLAIEGHGLTGGLLLSHLLVEQQREDGHDKKYHEWN